MSSKPTLGQVAVTIGAIVCTAVGLNTAWGFTHSHLHITQMFTRIALCGTGEIVLISLGLAARDNMRAKGSTGLPGILVWVITAFLAVPAFAEASSQAGGAVAGMVAGAWRATLGPICAAFLWHLAMGLEIRRVNASAHSGSVIARIGRRIGQSVLARFGISDRDLTAEDIARGRARVRAANLTDKLATLPTRRQAGRRGARLRRQLRATLRDAGVAHDDAQRALLLADLAVSAHAADLVSLDHASPWHASPIVVSDSAATTPEPVAPLVNGYEDLAPVVPVASDDVPETARPLLRTVPAPTVDDNSAQSVAGTVRVLMDKGARDYDTLMEYVKVSHPDASPATVKRAAQRYVRSMRDSAGDNAFGQYM